MDGDSGYTCTMFELDGGQIAERLMQALADAEDPDVFEHGGFGLLSGFEGAATVEIQ